MLGRGAISALPVSGGAAAIVPPQPRPIHAVSDGEERRRRRTYRDAEAKRRSDLERAFEALTASPEPRMVQRALDIARPALSPSEAPRLDAQLLPAPRAAQLLALWQCARDESESLLVQEDEEFLQLIL